MRNEWFNRWEEKIDAEQDLGALKEMAHELLGMLEQGEKNMRGAALVGGLVGGILAATIRCKAHGKLSCLLCGKKRKGRLPRRLTPY